MDSVRYCSTIKPFMEGNHDTQTSSRGHGVLDNHLSTSKAGLELTTDKLYQGVVYVQKKRTHSLKHLNMDLTPSIKLLLLRSPCPEQRSLCSACKEWKMKEAVVLCCKSFETDGVTGFGCSL